MIKQQELAEELRKIFDLEAEVLELCQRQLGNGMFLSGIAPQNRPDAVAELQGFLANSRRHQAWLGDILSDIQSGGRDVY